MKKISVVLVAVLLLFSGCGNDYRNVELSDFSVYIHTIDVGKPNYFRETVNAVGLSLQDGGCGVRQWNTNLLCG